MAGDAPSETPPSLRDRAEARARGALSEGNARLAVPAAAWVGSTYFAEGLPYSLVHQVSAQLFTDLGADERAVGLTALYGLAWNLKFVWSPFVGAVGSTRRWLLAMEVALVVLTALLVAPVASRSLVAVAWLLVPMSFVAATHDVAIDGHYLERLPEARQSSLSGLRILAYRAALLTGNGALVALAGLASWPVSFAVAAVLFAALVTFHALVLPEPATTEASSGPTSEVTREPTREPVRAAQKPSLTPGSFVSTFVSFVAKPGAVLAILFILFFRAGDALLFAMSAKLFASLGIGTSARGLLGGIGTAASIGGSMLGGVLIARVGFSRAFVPIAITQSVAIPLYSLLAWLRPSFGVVCAIVSVEQLVAGVGTTALLVFLMRAAAGPHKTAHFAIATALMSVATTVVGSASGFLAKAIGYERYFLVAFVASLPGVLLAARVRRWCEPAPA